MDTKQFEEIVAHHSLCPTDMMYNANALAGEAGECCNAVKKLTMAELKPEWVTQNENRLPNKEVFTENLKEELSDSLFYLTQLAKCAGTTLDELMLLQFKKLGNRSVKYQRTFLK